jgi:hypothetical protein
MFKMTRQRKDAASQPAFVNATLVLLLPSSPMKRSVPVAISARRGVSRSASGADADQNNGFVQVAGMFCSWPESARYHER